MKAIHIVAWILIIVGGLNWGLVGLSMLVNGTMDWNIVHVILGNWPSVEGIVYVLVGLSAIWELVMHRKTCKVCSGSMM